MKPSPCYTFRWTSTIAILLFLLASPVSSIATTRQANSSNNNEYDETTLASRTFIVLEEIPHDASSYTQGLTVVPTLNGTVRLFESAGLYGRSDVREVNPTTGDVIQRRSIPIQYFAEGLTTFFNVNGQLRLLQITWKERTGWVIDPDTLEVEREFRFTTTNNEGWGITYHADMQQFIVSDGSDVLHFWDRDTLQEVTTATSSRLSVKQVTAHTRSRGGIALLTRPETQLNELELMEDGLHVLANVWMTNRIVKIDLKTGFIVRDYDFSSLNRQSCADVLNGISQTGVQGEYWVTGKLWDTMYRVKLLI